MNTPPNNSILSGSALIGDPPLLIATFALLSLLSSVGPLHAGETTGRVQSIYYELARGVLMDKPNGKNDAIRWADVKLDTTASPDHGHSLAKIPPELAVSVGDTVVIDVHPRSRIREVVLSTPTRITAVRPAPLDSPVVTTQASTQPLSFANPPARVITHP